MQDWERKDQMVPGGAVSGGAVPGGAVSGGAVSGGAVPPAPGSSSTSPFGLLGRTLGHSWSPQIHALLGSIPYTLFEREPKDVAEFIRKGTWRGINVTMPYKPDAYKLADEASDRACRMGVANTLVRRSDGTIFADNTDLAGFAWMLDRFCQRQGAKSAAEALAGQKVLVLGAGGASQAVQAALADAGAHAVVFDLKGAIPYEELPAHRSDAVLVINATPVGMYPNCPASLLSASELIAMPKLQGVLDVVYNPTRTGIILAAERCGIPAESGLAMLVAQARFSSELFQNCSIADEEVERIEDHLRAQMTNICLIGMPGAGKTSAGAALAHILKRPFIDLDTAFELEHGQSAEAYIIAYGESAFREAETEITAAYSARSGLVIACGGGVVEREENYDLLHQNSVIVMLERDIGMLSVNGRPISQAHGIAQLASRRMSKYHGWADLVIACTGSPAGDAEILAHKLGYC